MIREDTHQDENVFTLIESDRIIDFWKQVESNWYNTENIETIKNNLVCFVNKEK